MTTLGTERLLLRNFQLADSEALHEMIVQYQASEYAAYDHQWPTSPEEIKKITAWFAGGESFLAVCLRESGKLIGFVALNEEASEAGREYSIGYCFNSDFHGKGYASEACRAAISHAFGDLQAQSVVTGTAAANHPSCRLLERLGFTRTAESVGSFQSTPDGKPIEFLGYAYALAREDWERADRDVMGGAGTRG